MGNKNKITILASLAIAILIMLSVTAYASEDIANETPHVITEEEFISAEQTDDSELTHVAMDGDFQAEENFFEEFYSNLTENSDKIFAALAFIGTMAVSLTYKKGLLPLLNGAMNALRGSVEKIKENECELTRRTDDALGILSERTQSIVDENTSTKSAIVQINERLSEFENVENQYCALRTVLSSQIDMLYAIFMSSALPQYQKEEVGNKISQMKEELSKHEKQSD